MKDDLTAEYVRSILDYDPATGEFRWKYRWDTSPQWNGKFPGRIAGSVKEDSGYCLIAINASLYRAHRLAWLIMTDRWPDDDIDHRDLNRSNNSWSNLREATRSQNLVNTGLRKTNTVGLKGVHVHKQSGRYRAQMTVDRKQLHIGYFDCPAAAHLAFVIQSEKHRGSFARHS